MSDIPVGGGNGPGGIRPGGVDGASAANNELNFKPLAQGSSTTELIRGQISQARTAAPLSTTDGQPLGFRANVPPSATAQAIMARLSSQAA